MKLMKRLIFLFVSFFLFFLPRVAFADNSWVIENFHSAIGIQKTGTIQVAETISVDFRITPEPGIYRDIPRQYEVNGKQLNTNIHITKVLQNNLPAAYATSQKGIYEEVQIGDPKKTVVGRNVYTIVYTVIGALRPTTNYDELYWDVTGNNWPVQIQKAEATITLPKEGIQKSSCYEGAIEAQISCSSTIASATKALFAATNILNPMQGLTVVVDYKKGLVPLLCASSPFVWLILVLVCLILLTGVVLYIIKKYRKRMVLDKRITIRAIRKADRHWVKKILTKHWGSTIIVSRGEIHDTAKLSGFIAWINTTRVGVLTYAIEKGSCEIVSLNSEVEKHGAGTLLIKKVREIAKRHKCKRLWLVETNDNTTALYFYQKRGVQLVALHKDAIEVSRRLKPQIPLADQDGIPIRDELELEMRL
jgi:hypothetical protein